MEVTLAIGEEHIKISKEVLCEFSDYFRAMFSGNYAERDQNLVNMDMVDPDNMKIIVQYMKIGLIDLSEFTLNNLNDLLVAATYLQITELLTQIEYVLELKINDSNWLEIKKIAETAAMSNLVKYAVAHGLYHFHNIDLTVIPSLDILYWYLSHPYLNVNYEFDVFKFGFDWVCLNQMSATALLVVLGSLDLSTLTSKQIMEIEFSLKNDYKNSLVCRMVECMHEMIIAGWDISPTSMVEHSDFVLKSFSQKVYDEITELAKQSKPRLVKMIPCIHGIESKLPESQRGPHYIYKFENNSFVKWLEMSNKSLWGWNIVAWGAHKLVMVGGEYGRGTGQHNRDVAVYDTIKKEWIKHGVQLPPHRHSSVVVHKDHLYIFGGVGAFRVVLDTTIKYDLKNRSFHRLANLPEPIQKPAVCLHKGVIFVANYKDIYSLSESGDTYEKILSIKIRSNYMVSLCDHIYITQSYFGHLYGFRPGFDHQLEPFGFFSNAVAAMCNSGGKITAFTQTACGQLDNIAVEEYYYMKTKVLMSEENSDFMVNEATGCCVLIMTPPQVNCEVSQYPVKYINKINHGDVPTADDLYEKYDKDI